MTRLPAGTIDLSHFLPLPGTGFSTMDVVAALPHDAPIVGVQVVVAAVSLVALAAAAEALATVALFESLVVTMVIGVPSVTLEAAERREKLMTCLFCSAIGAWLALRICSPSSSSSDSDPWCPLASSTTLFMPFDGSG